MVLDSEFALRLLYTILVAAGISCAITPLVKWFAKTVGAMDIPKDQRRMHHKPIPRMGGLSIVLAFLVSFLIFGEFNREIRGILIGAGMIVTLGIVDDIKALKALPKFIVQIASAVVVVAHGCRIELFLGWVLPAWLSCIASVIWIVMITNAVNFIDGLDGLAAGVSAISAGTMLVVALLLFPEHNASLSALILAAIVGGCIGFIPYNFNPASIFMGDTGSTFLGFMLASVSIFGLFKTYAMISFAVPFLVVGLPLFDICFAVIRRVAKGQSPMHADRGHVHHRLIDMGFSQKQAVAISYLISAVLGIFAVVLADKGHAGTVIFLVVLIIVGTVGLKHCYTKRPHKKHEEEQNSDEEN
ncbi:MAG: undecaprenyl/decaprenyl-phosphate alpha-N-acetylglucosaminyl 1-phosphate transferase [Oscillospiraceae bacterium]|nr:undecaprenyl/decaprenyl-phosphate alpha-N-acetylglucosaminyl 1-phosphate transferase [Oscillospiraceae bacterium]